MVYRVGEGRERSRRLTATALERRCYGVATVLLRWGYGTGPMWVAQLSGIAALTNAIFWLLLSLGILSPFSVIAQLDGLIQF